MNRKYKYSSHYLYSQKEFVLSLVYYNIILFRNKMDQIVEVEAESCPKCELKECELETVKDKLSSMERDNIILRQKLVYFENNYSFINSLFNQTQAAQLLIDPVTNTPVVSIVESLPIRTSPEILIPTQVYINAPNQVQSEDIKVEPTPDSTDNSVAYESDNSGENESMPAVKQEEMDGITMYTSAYPDTIYDFSNDICSYISANITRGVSSSTIQKCLATAHNEAHFAARLAQKMFTKEELSTSNITGRTSIPGRAINKLDTHRLDLIKQAVCYAYKMDYNSENVKNIWKKCKMSINEVCRRPRRSRVQLSNSPFKYVTTKGINKSPKIDTITPQVISYPQLAQLIPYTTDAQIVPSGTDYVILQNQLDMSSYSPVSFTIKEANSVDQSPEPTN